MKLKLILTFAFSALILSGCSEDATEPEVSCTDLQAEMDAALLAYVVGETSALCLDALAAMTALKDNSCNASTTMLDEDGVTWVVDAEDVAEVQAACDAL